MTQLRKLPTLARPTNDNFSSAPTQTSRIIKLRNRKISKNVFAVIDILPDTRRPSDRPKTIGQQWRMTKATRNTRSYSQNTRK